MGCKGKSNGEGKSVYCVRGVQSPLLANVYLHELDKFMETTLKANPTRESKKETNARRTKESRQIENRITAIRKRLTEESFPGNEALREELQGLEKKRKSTPNLQTRPTKGYVRYTDGTPVQA
jgi:RNA-directed DNA polymerase